MRPLRQRPRRRAGQLPGPVIQVHPGLVPNVPLRPLRPAARHQQVHIAVSIRVKPRRTRILSL